jgi:hypothetical protein
MAKDEKPQTKKNNNQKTDERPKLKTASITTQASIINIA